MTDSVSVQVDVQFGTGGPIKIVEFPPTQAGRGFVLMRLGDPFVVSVIADRDGLQRIADAINAHLRETS